MGFIGILIYCAFLTFISAQLTFALYSNTVIVWIRIVLLTLALTSLNLGKINYTFSLWKIFINFNCSYYCSCSFWWSFLLRVISWKWLFEMVFQRWRLHWTHNKHCIRVDIRFVDNDYSSYVCCWLQSNSFKKCQTYFYCIIYNV